MKKDNDNIPLISPAVEKLLAEAVGIEQDAAQTAGALGYMARVMVQASLPYRDPKIPYYTRTNGNFKLVLTSLSDIGLPYGNIPRLINCWISTEVVKTRQRVLFLGENLTDFMEQIGLETITGGKNGSITRLRNQTRKLFACCIGWSYLTKGEATGHHMTIADDYHFWWDVKNPDQNGLWASEVKLSERFYQEILDCPVPVDIRALKALKDHPMALDVYCWLVYRMSYLKKPSLVPWEALQMQFGATYARTRDFRAAFLTALRKALTIYARAKVDPGETGLLLKPSPLHIARR